MTGKHVIYLETVEGAALTTDGECLLDFRTGPDAVSVVFPPETARTAAALMFSAAADIPRADGEVGGLPIDSMAGHRTIDGWVVLEFGVGRGILPIALDVGQVGELQRLLVDAKVRQR